MFNLVGTKIDKRQDIKVQGSKKSTQYQKITGTTAVTEAEGKRVALQIKATSYIECSALTTQVIIITMDIKEIFIAVAWMYT